MARRTVLQKSVIRSRCRGQFSAVILASNTGQTVETIEKDTDRDYIMTAAESQKYGLIDEVITNRA